MRGAFHSCRLLTLALACVAIFDLAALPRHVDAQGTHRVYLPLVAKRYPPTKIRSGIHLGNRGNSVWNSPTDFLTRLKGTPAGDYPRLAVVLSNQLYNVRRTPTGACNITDAQKLGNTYLYDYLTEAVRTKGTIIVIRIYPSPGNFSDWNNPGPNHNLISQPDTATPNNGTYCNGNHFNYRAPRDVAREMKAIYDLNIANGWPADRFFFEPANEPNKEWYWGKGDVIPNADSQYAWQAMDSYFVAVYNAAKSLNSSIRVLTPPMAQGVFAEYREFGTCTLSGFVGYDHMRNVYETKNDGWSWHNYWRSGLEFWQDSFCSSSNIVSDHVFQYFPQWLQSKINSDTRLAFITEADLLSPCQGPDHHLDDKDATSNSTQESIWRFIQQERGADYVATWLLTNQFADPPTLNCFDQDDNDEIAWHEAYRDAGPNYERDWFRLWWLRNE